MRGRILRHTIAVLIAALMVALTGSLVGCDSTQKTEEEIRIGAILSLSGTYASMGQAQDETLRLEVEAINKSGGINGKPLKLIIEDDATAEAKAISAASKLILRDKVELILAATGTGASMAIRPLLVEHQVPQISMAGGSVITADFSPNVFQTPWPNELLISELFTHLASQGITKIAFVYDSGGYGKDGYAVAEALQEEAGVDIVLETSFKPQDTDMSSQVAQVKSSDAQALVLWNAGKEASLFVNQALSAGLNLPMYGGSGLAREEFSSAVGPAAQGLTIITGKSFIPISWGEGSEEYLVNEDYAQRFSAEYGHKPDIFAGHSFDAIHLAAQALASEEVQAKTPNMRGEEIRKALESEAFTGYGGVFSFSSTDHNGLGPDDIAYFHIDEMGAWATGMGEGSVASENSSNSNLVNLSIASLRNAAFYTLIALGFLAVFMATGAINFAQGEFVALSGLIAATLVALGIPVLLAFLLSLLLMGLLGLVFHRLLIDPLSKASGTAIVIVSVGASILLRQIALHIFGPNELRMAALLEGGLDLCFMSIDWQSLILLLIALITYAAFIVLLRKTRFGKAMRAYSIDRRGAELCGVNPQTIVGASFILAAVFGALAGSLITPISQMSFDSGMTLGVKGFSVAILGGLSNPIATPFAALLLSGLESLVGLYISPVVKEIVAFVLLLGVLILRPQGLFSKKEREKL